MAVEKISISLPGETLGQLEWIKENVLHCVSPMSRSALIQMAIGMCYYRYMSDQ